MPPLTPPPPRCREDFSSSPSPRPRPSPAASPLEAHSTAGAPTSSASWAAAPATLPRIRRPRRWWEGSPSKPSPSATATPAALPPRARPTAGARTSTGSSGSRPWGRRVASSLSRIPVRVRRSPCLEDFSSTSLEWAPTPPAGSPPMGECTAGGPTGLANWATQLSTTRAVRPGWQVSRSDPSGLLLGPRLPVLHRDLVTRAGPAGVHPLLELGDELGVRHVTGARVAARLPSPTAPACPRSRA